MFNSRHKYAGREYFSKQVTLMRWFVFKHHHTEQEYVDRFAVLFEKHHSIRTGA